MLVYSPDRPSILPGRFGSFDAPDAPVGNLLFSRGKPLRRVLITGRNHHSMGFGVVTEQSTGFPCYNSVMTWDKATIGKDS